VATDLQSNPEGSACFFGPGTGAENGEKTDPDLRGLYKCHNCLITNVAEFRLH